MLRRFARFAPCLVLALSLQLSAQWESDGPSATLRINGVQSSLIDPSDHDVVIGSPVTMNVDIGSGQNPFMPLLLAASTVEPTGTAIRQIPGLGIINIGTPAVPLPAGIVLIGDGIGRSVNPVTDALFVTNGSMSPSYAFQISLGTNLCEFSAAFQAVVVDPSAFPFSLDMTEAADVDVVPYRSRQILVHGQVTSLPVSIGPDFVFDFHGQAYSQLWVSRYGFISFGGPTSVTNGGFTNDARSFVSREPAIAAWMGDWDPQAFGTNDGILIDRERNRLSIRWGDPAGMPSGAPGCAHTTDFDFNRFGIDLVLRPTAALVCASFDPHYGRFAVGIESVGVTTTVFPGNGLLGHTKGGGNSLATAFDRDLHSPQAAGAGIAMVEEHDATGENESVIGWNVKGTPRYYNDIRSWDQTAVTFDPVASMAIGGSGYTSSSSRGAPADIVGIVPMSIRESGGEVIGIVGKFDGFSDAQGPIGNVTFIDANGVSMAASVLGVRDSTGQVQLALPHSPSASSFRDRELLEIMTPSLVGHPSPITMRVTFADGFIRNLAVNTYAVNPTDIFTSGDDVFHRYHLRSAPVRFYGTTYSEIFISSNGLVTFTRPKRFASLSTSPFALLQGFFGLVDLPSTPAVAAAWTDLAPSVNGAPPQIMVTQDLALGSTKVSWIGFDYFQTITPCGTFSVEFLPADTIRFDHSSIISSSFFAPPSFALTGVSNGSGSPVLTNFVPGQMFSLPGLSLARAVAITSLGTWASFNGVGNGTWHAQDLGANGTWSIF